MDYHNWSPIESGPHQNQTCVVKCDTSTPYISSNQEQKELISNKSPYNKI